MKSITDSSKNLNINYTYNKDGIRTQKQIGNKYTSYYLEGTDIVLERTNGNMLYYMRDDTGSLIGFKYNDDTYYYIKNLQEDIIGIKDADFNTIATYSYDAWGSITSIKDATGNEITDKTNIAHINPFRYRSYYYDNETDLYYLNSRYYSPKLGRFINADSTVLTNQGMFSGNMYSYTENNPITRFDPNGKIWLAVVAFSLLCGIGEVVQQSKKRTIHKFDDGLKYFIKGTVNGATWLYTAMIPEMGLPLKLATSLTSNEINSLLDCNGDFACTFSNTAFNTTVGIIVDYIIPTELTPNNKTEYIATDRFKDATQNLVNNSFFPRLIKITVLQIVK